ncbi:MAG TPA: DUF4157 domain-containing protein [Telluria sp.]|jgi:hypothetical protein
MRVLTEQPKLPQSTPASSGRKAPMPGHMAGASHLAQPSPIFDFSRTPLGRHNTLYRQASGAGPALAPALVHEVLRGQGKPLPADVLRDAETRLGHNFADVRVHTDARSGESARAVSANAYTVGRQIVFAPGHFNPASGEGRRLLTHELSHAAAHPSGAPTPSGSLRISTPGEPSERHALAVSEGAASSVAAGPAASSSLFRQTATPVPMMGVAVNHARVTVPPPAGLSFTAAIEPADATGVTLAVGGPAAIAPGTRVSSAGVITLARAQQGGNAEIQATQTLPVPNAPPRTTTRYALFNLCAIPGSIASTTATNANLAGSYGGDFVHTFTSPAGGASALTGSHLNEQFPAASNGLLPLSGTIGAMDITILDPDSPGDGWDLDANGRMTGFDRVSWTQAIPDARPFVRNASHPAPSPALPQAITATQNFRNLTLPDQTYRATRVASTTHRRAFEEQNGLIKAVTSANGVQVIDPYAGPTIFRRCRATPASIPATAPAAPGATAVAASTSTIVVDAEGQTATPVFSVKSPDLGCTITTGGVLTPGATAGTVTVRAGDAANFDETTVTVTAPVAAPTPSAPPAP